MATKVLGDLIISFLIVLVGLFSIIKCVSMERNSDYFIVSATDKPGYQPTWDSLDARPLPHWYDAAKIGIFIHWGVYSVPAFGSEWFWINWMNGNPKHVDFMKKNFKPGFTYQEFASAFTAEFFDANEWAKLFEKSGAKYVVLTSKHHDGYALWDSKYSFSWNSKDVGPHRDLVAELATAIRTNTSLVFGLYHSLFEWFHPLYKNEAASNFSENYFVTTKILPEMKELIYKYKPEVLWSDGDWEAPYTYWNSTEFIAWLYNESPVKDTIVTNDRWGKDTLCKHGDFYTCSDRYNPGVLQLHKYENCMTLDKKSWGYRANARLEDYLTPFQLIEEIVITVSTGGNILINVGPTHRGTIDPIFVERLEAMGKWLGVNGEAIYDSTPWTHQNDTKTPDIWYTSKKQPNSQRTIVYAVLLHYPYDSTGVNLYSLAHVFEDHTTVALLGYPEKLSWKDMNDSVFIELPANKAQLDKLGLDLAWTLKITI